MRSDRTPRPGRAGRSFPLPAAAAALSLLVTLPAPAVAQEPAVAAGVPTPESVIGWEPGADYEVADYAQVLAYFRALDEASDRLRLEEIGETAEGRTMVLALISSAENLERLDRWKEISRSLAMGEAADSAAARALAAEGRAVLWIDGGLHSTELAGSQFPPKLAHRLVTEESEEVRAIRDRVVLLLMPVMNPDGLDIVADWYRRTVGTPYEGEGPPELYQKYVGHDNNRDWFMIQQPETRAVARQLWHEWYPQIVVNHHQTAPFPARIFIPPFADPVNPNIPPLVVAGNNLVGTTMHRRFIQEDKPGAVSRIGFTQWWNGGMRTAPYFHNQIGILTEVAHDSPTPRDYDPDSLPETFSDGTSAQRPSTWYPMPWEGGPWGLGDAVDYMVTASMAVADLAAERKESWLFDSWRMARRAVERGEEGDPAAYVVSLDDQRDPGEAVALLETLRRGGVRVERAPRSFRAGDREYPAGTFVLPTAQPYRAFLRDLLEPQDYPDRRLYPGGPPDVPYDLAGWTLPLQMGVSVDRIPEPVTAATEPVRGTEIDVALGGVEGEGALYLVSPTANAAFRAVNRLLPGVGASADGAGTGEASAGTTDGGGPAGAARVQRTAEPFEAGGRTWPAGTFVVRGDRGRLAAVADSTGVTFVAADGVPVAVFDLRRPRVGLYKSWDASMDEGWTRWVLERYGFAYESLRDSTLRAGDLSRFDAIVLPSQDAEDILHGHPPGSMPPEYTGGIGLEGAVALKRFVEEGGLLLAFDEATDFAIRQFGLPLRVVTEGLDPRDFFIPGSLIRVRVDDSDPIAYGMADEAAAFFVRSRAFRTADGAGDGTDGASGTEEVPAAEEAPAVDVVARYAEEDLLMSGWALGAERVLGGRAAVARVPMGEGHVVVIGFRPQFRAQPRSTFKLLFNSLYAATMGDLPVRSMAAE